MHRQIHYILNHFLKYVHINATSAADPKYKNPFSSSCSTKNSLMIKRGANSTKNKNQPRPNREYLQQRPAPSAKQKGCTAKIKGKRSQAEFMISSVVKIGTISGRNLILNHFFFKLGHTYVISNILNCMKKTLWSLGLVSSCILFILKTLCFHNPLSLLRCIYSYLAT